MKRKRIQLAVVCSGVLMASTVFATTWIVDDDGKADFGTIQAAIDAASNGDEILVFPGTYTGSGDNVIDMLGKSIWLHSVDGHVGTYIDGENARRGIICVSGETNTTVIEGFTIQNCDAPWHDWDGDGIVDNWEPAGGGMGNSMSSPSLIDCLFTNKPRPSKFVDKILKLASYCTG